MIEIGMIATLLASSVRSPTCQVGLGMVPAGKATELAPSTHSQEKKVPGWPCSTAATMISARPIVEMRAAIGGAFLLLSGRKQTCSMTNPITADAAMPRMQAIQNDWPRLTTSEYVIA